MTASWRLIRSFFTFVKVNEHLTSCKLFKAFNSAVKFQFFVYDALLMWLHSASRF
jgi:hypothetical protein